MLWVKTLHVLFVISWFGGLFYLPRIYVNLAQHTDEAVRACLLGMARRLYRFMTMLAVMAIALGLVLWLGYGLGSGQGWLHAKLFVVLLLLGYHHACARMLRGFESGATRRSARFYR